MSCNILNDSPSENFGKGREYHRADTEANNENTDTNKGYLFADSKLVNDTFDIGCYNSRAKGHNKTGEGDDHGAVPLAAFGPVLGILGVIL